MQRPSNAQMQLPGRRPPLAPQSGCDRRPPQLICASLGGPEMVLSWFG
jgi:hypothetical protein